jgi:RND family efflux transporter MFP subunit
MPLVRLSDNRRLRLDFPVSVDYVSSVRDDSPVTVRVDSLGGRTFAGKIARFTHRIDESTRTMRTEVEVPNDSLDLIPGMYATVTLRIDERLKALAVPVEAVPSGATSVFVVNSSQQLEERHIKLGLETATRYEVLEGLNEGDRVVIGNTAQLRAGQQVEAKLTEPSEDQPSEGQ